MILAIQCLILQALAKPLSMFIWVYGIYIALTPLFIYYRRSDGTNLVNTVSQKAADLGAAIAVVWFIFMLVSNDWSHNIMIIAWYHPVNYWDMQ